MPTVFSVALETRAAVTSLGSEQGWSPSLGFGPSVGAGEGGPANEPHLGSWVPGLPRWDQSFPQAGPPIAKSTPLHPKTVDTGQQELSAVTLPPPLLVVGFPLQPPSSGSPIIPTWDSCFSAALWRG